MTAKATATQAQMERAIRAARNLDCPAVEVSGGVIRILVNPAEPVQPSPQVAGDNTCDKAFGVSD